MRLQFIWTQHQIIHMLNYHPTTSASANEIEKKRKRKEYKTTAYNKLLSSANNQDRPISITTAKK